jgi:PilZ domain
MKERRTTDRRPVSITGVIILDESKSRIQCRITDLSEKGAGIETLAIKDIPEEFNIVIEGIRRRCRLVWRADTKIGVAFLE